MKLIKRIVFRVFESLKQHPGLMAIFGFFSGVASYVLVEGREAFAQAIATLMLVSWLLLVMEPWIRALFLKLFGVPMPRMVMRFGTQMVHQESLFFALPFFLAATTWNHTQALFTSALILSAFVSVIDPIYHGQLARRRSLYMVFHAMTLFAVLLVVLPLILLLNTEQSLQLALVVALLFSLPSLGDVMPNGRWWRLPMMVLALIALGAALWQARILIPPAALELNGITLSQQMNREQRSPGQSLDSITEEALRTHGLYAWTSVRAPRGLRENIHHVWMRDGVVMDRITLDIEGGDSGYRAWTHKLNFPADVIGSWQVRVMTDSGQLIGLTRFEVVGNPQPTSDTN
ncbi:MAG: DUF5924 family protein [Gammaproteobacteria bacterium]|nr:DUF5924 family protein [Gammaproteobacteria bacterium]MDP2139986.1 DUF5924 family protein [Gammaproteobacteria bacterium]MDP2347806.1 DUF5924 family protein [Gammaproteobacteria bacterium]